MTLQTVPNLVAIEVDEATNLVTLYQDNRVESLSIDQRNAFEQYLNSCTNVDLLNCMFVVHSVDMVVPALVA